MKSTRYLIVLASGSGARFGSKIPKQFVRLGGKMIIEYTLKSCDCGVFDEIVLVVPQSYIFEITKLVREKNYAVKVTIVAGGTSRKESCEIGVAAIRDEDGFVVVHNGVQPFITREVFLKCIDRLDTYSAVTSGVPCVYTILETDSCGELQRILPRANCFEDLGPECFRLPLLRKALQLGKQDSEFTNLTSLFFKYNLGRVLVTKGDSRNVKITYPEDIVIAERLLRDGK